MKTSLIFKALGFSLAISHISAQTFTTNPVGMNQIVIPAHTDVALAVPLNPPHSFEGTVKAIEGNKLTLSSEKSIQWAANQFVPAPGTADGTFLIQFASGAKEGMTVRIIQNTADTLTLSLSEAEDLSGIQSAAANGPDKADHVDIRACSTPHTLFGSSPPEGMQLLIHGHLTSTNFQVWEHQRNGIWTDLQSKADVSHTPMDFISAFILRNPTSSPIPLAFTGNVGMTRQRLTISLAGTTDNYPHEIRIGCITPVPTPLSAIHITGLIPGDELYAFGQNRTGYNQSPSQRLIYTGNGWQDSDTHSSAEKFMLQPSNGYILRKKTSPTPQTVVWTSLPSYLK